MDKITIVAQLKASLEKLNDGTYKSPREYTTLQNEIYALCAALDKSDKEGK